MKKNGVVPKIDRTHFIGHCEIDPVTRTACPGKQFPYEQIIDEVLGSSSAAAPAQKKETEVRTLAYTAAVRSKPSTYRFY